MIRVVVVDDHPLVLKGIAGILAGDPDIEVVGTASDIEEAVATVEREAPDVLLLDVRLRDGTTGLDVLRQVPQASPATRVVMLTVIDDDAVVTSAMRLGARGYLLKSASAEHVRSAVRRVAAGFSHLDPAISDVLLREVAPSTADETHLDLSPREIDVLRLVAAGMTNDVIGSHLGIGTETVKTHLSRAFLRLGAKDRAHAVAIALKRGMI